MSPELIFLSELALKMALTAFIVVIVSVTVERSGPFIGALIAALPTAAGAAYIILAFEHPPDFIAASAVGSAAATASVSIFCLVYAVLAQRHGLVLSLGVAVAIIALAGGAVALVWRGAVDELVAFTVGLVAFGVASQVALRQARGAQDVDPARPAPRSSRPKRAVLLINPKSGGGKAERFNLPGEARKRGVDTVVCGHIHHAEIRDIDGIRYCNDGDWVESCTSLVEDMSGQLRLIDWPKVREQAQPAPMPLPVGQAA